MFYSKHIKAVLRDAALRKALLNHGSITLEKYIDFDQQGPELKDEIIENINETLQAYGPFQLHYPSPVEQLPEDAWIYGTTGVYVVANQDGYVVFTRKVNAVRYADQMSSVSGQIASSEGWINI